VNYVSPLLFSVDKEVEVNCRTTQELDCTPFLNVSAIPLPASSNFADQISKQVRENTTRTLVARCGFSQKAAVLFQAFISV
jgi:hypothetical protein